MSRSPAPSVRLADAPELAVSVDHAGSTRRVLVTGRASSSHDVDVVRAAIRAVCRESPRRIVVDLNSVDELDASMLAAVIAIRDEAADTVIAIDISRLHGPLLLALLARLIDPDGAVASGACAV